jgi:predicted nucleic acid-binding protein
MTTLQITVRDDVKERVTAVAEKQHISLEDFTTMALMEKLSTLPDLALEQRAARGNRKDFDAFLDLAPDVPPEDYDKLE